MIVSASESIDVATVDELPVLVALTLGSAVTGAVSGIGLDPF